MLKLAKTETELHEGWLTIWINRPEKRNALEPVILDEIAGILKWAKNKDKITGVLLRGRGKSFCSGADINWMKESGTKGPKLSYAESQMLSFFYNMIYTCDKVTVNMLHGHVYGGALGFLGSGDFSFALHDSVFAFPETRLGLFPAIILPYLLLRSRIPDLRHKLFTGSAFSAQEALEMGLLDGIFENMDDMEAAVTELIMEFRAVSPAAVAEGKKIIRSLHKDLINAKNTERTIKALSGLKLSKDAQDRMSFIKKSGNK